MLIPTSNENEDHETPVISIALIIFCWLVYFYQCHANKTGSDFTRTFGFVSGDYVPAGYKTLPVYMKFWLLLKMFFNPFSTGWLRALSSSFLHANLFHVIGNMSFLAIFGDNVEHAMGKLRFTIFFLLTAFLAQFAQTLIGGVTDIPTIGASGAISAIMGAYVVYYPHSILNVRYGGLRTGGTMRMTARSYLGFFLITQFFIGFSTWGAKYTVVAIWAHVGGCAFGFLLAGLFKDPEMMFKEEADKLFGSASRDDTHGEANDKTFGGYKPVQRVHKRPPLSEMRSKGKAEAKRRKERGIDWHKDP